MRIYYWQPHRLACSHCNRRAKCLSLPSQAGMTLKTQTANSAETGVKPGVLPVLVSASAWMRRRQTSHVPILEWGMSKATSLVAVMLQAVLLSAGSVQSFV